jgi:hypothetical protein
VDQYVIPGGAYTVTDADRAIVEAEIKKIEALQEKEGIVAADRTAYQARQASKAARTQDSVWGAVGKGVAPSNSALENQLRKLADKDGYIPLAKVLPHLHKALKDEGYSNRMVAFNLRLLGAIEKGLGAKGTKIRYITKDTAPDDNSPPKKDIENARGWYVIGTDYVGIKSSEFVHSSVTGETLLHELTHARVSAALDAMKADDPVVMELTDILNKAREYVDDSKISGFAPALGFKNKQTGAWPEITRDSLQELVAWGMTNVAFQRKVLDKISFESKNRERVGGFKKFVENILKVVFGRFTEVETTAMAGLIINTAALLNNKESNSLNNTARTLQMADPLESLTPLETFESLGSVSGVNDVSYENSLRNTLSSVVKTVFGTEGPVPALAEAQAAMDPMTAYQNAVKSGEMPFASQALAVLKLTAQEAFVLESTEQALKEAMNVSQVTREELRKLFTQARAAIKPQDFHNGDWSKATPEEKQRAENIHSFIFTPTGRADGKSDFLSRFAAAGLSYKPLHEKLAGITPRAEAGAKPKTLGQLLSFWFTRAMQRLAEFMTGTTRTQSGQEKLRALSNKLAQLHAKHKSKLHSEKPAIEDVADRVIQATVNPITQAVRDTIDSEWVAKTGEAFKKIARKTQDELDRVVTDQDQRAYLEKLRNWQAEERLGFWGELVNNIRGLKPGLEAWGVFERWASRYQGQRKFVIEGYSRLVRKVLPKMTKEQSAAVTRLVRLDLGSLLNTHDMEGIQAFLASNAKTEARINELRAKLPKQFREDYINHTVALGRFLATENWYLGNGFKNAYEMARLKEIADTSSLTITQLNDIEVILDELASLEGVLAMAQEVRNEALSLLNQPQGMSGIRSVFLMYKDLEREALAKNFNGNKSLMRKGHLKSIMNYRTEIVLADATRSRALEQAGFSKGLLLPKDPTDADAEPTYIHAIHGMGLVGRVTGIFSNKGERSRGTAMNQGIWDADNDRIHTKNFRELQQAKRKNAAAYQALKSRPGFDPRKHGVVYREATRNDKGEIVNYSYVMSGQTRDDLKERNNDIAANLGVLAGDIFDKAETKELNAQVVEALLEQYKADAGNPAEDMDRYIEFGPKHPDPVIAEAYRLLPEDTKRQIKKVWGTQHMLVRDDLYQMLFGYRKFALDSMLEQDEAQLSAGKEFFVKVLTWSFSDKDLAVEDMTGIQAERILRARLKIRQGQDIWEGIVAMVRDNWVIKNLFTSWANFLSNLWELWAIGVPPKDIIRNGVIGFKGIITYQRDKERLSELEWRLSAGVLEGDRKAAEAEIIELKDAMRRNPVAFMIDEGLFQTIIQDVAQEMDPYSYQNRFFQGIEDRVEKLPNWVKATGKTLLMTHDTPMYKLAYQFPAYTDFASRYVTYQYMVNRKKKPMTHAQAVQFVDDAFVNYDRPQHKALQFLNDSGLMPFTKYYIRIQRVLFHLMEENPARMMALAMAANLIPGMPTIADAVFWNKLEYSPFRDGAFEWLDSMGEIPFIKASMNVLD